MERASLCFRLEMAVTFGRTSTTTSVGARARRRDQGYPRTTTHRRHVLLVKGISVATAARRVAPTPPQGVHKLLPHVRQRPLHKIRDDVRGWSPTGRDGDEEEG